ncbi:CDP-alcohol phosphatidyltransferase family protein [[Clostridium] innocuum]|nr:CDP-alcohol phosphatidyltransferase family protein [[Clostridium] innocuum]
MKHLPNILSVVRIGLSFLLLALIKNITLFLIVYLIIGITDILDGWLARRLQVQSALGAHLDSIGDLAFYCISLYIVFFQMQLKIMNLISMLVLCVFVLKLAALLLTRWKHHIWASMHTIGNKLTGLLLFLLVPLCVITNSLPLIPVGLVIACSYLATFEEMLLILSRNTYDINTKSLLKK